jgi:hypothetical protein
MAAYRARMKAALDGLDATPMQADWLDNSRIILENNIAFIDDCLAKGSISLPPCRHLPRSRALISSTTSTGRHRRKSATG